MTEIPEDHAKDGLANEACDRGNQLEFVAECTFVIFYLKISENDPRNYEETVGPTVQQDARCFNLDLSFLKEVPYLEDSSEKYDG